MIRVAWICAALLAAAPAHAQEGGAFSEGSEANSWGLVGEEKARFTARVVDLLCEITGECAGDCGGGTRQLGLLREADGVLVFPNKNGQPLFTGAASDLAPFCGMTVEVDGLLVGGDEVVEGAPKIFQLQRIREEGGDWVKADRWTKDWASRNADLEGKGPWYRRDPRITREIGKDGYLGLGPEADKAFIRDWY